MCKQSSFNVFNFDDIKSMSALSKKRCRYIYNNIVQRQLRNKNLIDFINYRNFLKHKLLIKY